MHKSFQADPLDHKEDLKYVSFNNTVTGQLSCVYHGWFLCVHDRALVIGTGEEMRLVEGGRERGGCCTVTILPNTPPPSHHRNG